MTENYAAFYVILFRKGLRMEGVCDTMQFQFDFLLKGGRVVDPAHGFDSVCDLGVKDGKIAACAPELDGARAARVEDAAGLLVLPGIIDLHTHLSARHNGAQGHAMLAKAGVTTTLEISGPIESVLPIAKCSGAGLNLALLDQVHPGVSVRTNDPDEAELADLIDRTLEAGGLGIKLLGGHFPITPGSIARAIELSAEKKTYIAFHAGSTETGSHLNGALEAIALADGKPLHLAHVNSYCRGYVLDCRAEAERMLEALLANPNIRAESYLSPMNGCSSRCVDGVPESMVTRKCLERGGYEATQRGLEQAILAGWAKVSMIADGENVVRSGEKAAAYWRENGTVGSVGFDVNPLDSRLRLASARRPDGGFAVECIATDGGGHPRNVILSCGLPLVRLGAFTLSEFVAKTSLHPARWLGLADKGHLGVGADADITVVDPARAKAVTTIVGGRVVMHRGVVCGHGSQIITTERGRRAIKRQGLPLTVIDIAQTGYFSKKPIA